MKALLEIHVTRQSGWSSSSPAPTLLTTEVVAGDSLTDKIPEGMPAGKVVVKSIGFTEMVLQSWGLNPQDEDGRVDCTADVTGIETRLQKTQKLRLTTISTDGGTSYTITLRDLKD